MGRKVYPLVLNRKLINETYFDTSIRNMQIFVFIGEVVYLIYDEVFHY